MEYTTLWILCCLKTYYKKEEKEKIFLAGSGMGIEQNRRRNMGPQLPKTGGDHPGDNPLDNRLSVEITAADVPCFCSLPGGPVSHIRNNRPGRGWWRASPC